MTRTAELQFAERTDTGRVRTQNEDCLALSPAFGFALVADGMGGYSGGEVASRIAAAAVQEALEQGLSVLSAMPEYAPGRKDQLHQLMKNAISNANRAILDAACAEPQYQGMGTTLVVALVSDDKIAIAHVGDARAYRFRRGRLMQLTRDHSLLQEQVDAGLITEEAARFSEYRNLVTRAVGIEVDMEPEIHDHDAEPEDIYLLCSDGLSDMLASDEIENVMKDSQSGLQGMCDTLVQRANDSGGRDNISAVLIRVSGQSRETDRLLDRIRRWIG